MPGLAIYPKPVILSLLIGMLLLCAARSRAQTPESSASPASLEKRVHELEDTVRRFEAERSPAVPASATVTPTPGSKNQDANNSLAQPQTASPEESANSETYLLPDKASDGGGALAGWDDKRGFFLRSPDDRFTLRLTGQIQADYRAFLDGIDYTDIDSFLVRRARLGIEANMFGAYEFRLLPDFSNAQAPGVNASNRIQDAYMNVHYWDEFQVEVGKFKQPFSYE